MKRLLLLALLCLLPVLPIHAQEETPLPDVAYTLTDGLYVAGKDRQPILIQESGALNPSFSPQGTRLAFLNTEQTSGDINQEFVIVNLNDLSKQSIDATLLPNFWLVYLRWQNEDVFWFNTTASENDFDLMEIDLTLWRVEINSGRMTQFPLRGIAFPSPDGETVAVVNPGTYAGEPAQITVFDSNGTPLGEPYQYPAVSSGSHLPWLPNIQWVGDKIRFPLPDPDFVYTPQPVQLIEYSPFDGAAILGEIPATFPADTLWSPDGSQIAYLSPSTEEATQTVTLHNIASGEEEIIADNVPVGTHLVMWKEWLVYYTGNLQLWTADSGITSIQGEILSAAKAQGDALTLIKTDPPSSRIVYWQAGEETIIKDQIDPSLTSLVGGIQ